MLIHVIGKLHVDRVCVSLFRSLGNYMMAIMKKLMLPRRPKRIQIMILTGIMMKKRRFGMS